MSKHLDERIRRARKRLQNQYAFMDGDGGYQALITDDVAFHRAFRRESQNPWAYLDGDGRIAFPEDCKKSARLPSIKVGELLGPKRQDANFTKSDIESIVRNLQIKLWNLRVEIWPEADLIDPVEILDPVRALNCIGYSVDEEETLGAYRSSDGFFEVAGILDKPTAHVRISKRLPRQSRGFTVAHELGHAILHADVRMHRDRALDGSVLRTRDSKEFEADVFASLFLLPAKPVRFAFHSRFLTESFRLNETTAFALNSGSFAELRDRCRDLRGLSRLIADSVSYNGKHFYSLAEHFGVSVETMAIRLEELNLLQF